MFAPNAALKLLHLPLERVHKALPPWLWSVSSAAATYSLTSSFRRARCPSSILPQMVCIFCLSDPAISTDCSVEPAPSRTAPRVPPPRSAAPPVNPPRPFGSEQRRDQPRGPPPPGNRAPTQRPRGLSASSVMDSQEREGRRDRERSDRPPRTESEERRRRERRKEREDRHRREKEKIRTGGRSKKPQGLDIIDKLDVTGIYGQGRTLTCRNTSTAIADKIPSFPPRWAIRRLQPSPQCKERQTRAHGGVPCQFSKHGSRRFRTSELSH